MLNINDVGDTFEIPVLVQFQQKGGTVKQGDFIAEFRRESKENTDDCTEGGYNNVDLLFDGWKNRNDESIPGVIVSVRKIGRSPTEELPPDEAMAFVRRTSECVNAAAVAFFKATRPERYNEQTSKKQRARG